MSNRDQIKARIERDKARKAKKRYDRAHGIFQPNNGIDLELLSIALQDAADRCWWCGKSIRSHLQSCCKPKPNLFMLRVRKLDKIMSLEQRLMAITPFGEFERVFTIQNLIKSLQKRRKGVEWKGNVQKLIFHAVLKLKRMKDDLLNGVLDVDKTIRRIVLHERGKRRIIHAVMIDCRVVQGCLCDSCLIPLTEYKLIRDNPASVKGKGVGDARKRLNGFMVDMARKHKNNFYVLTTDIKKFFDSIRHIDCLKVLREAYTDRMIQGLGMKIARMYQEAELSEIHDPRLRDQTATALKKCKGVGLTLGSQESQIMALVVPNPVDHAIKDGLGIKVYERYMDDTISASRFKEDLKIVGKTIKEKCEEKGLYLNAKKTVIAKASKGFKFLQILYSVSDSGQLVKRLARAGIVRMRRKLKKFYKMVRRGVMSLDDVFYSFSAWFGNSFIASAYHARKNMLALYKRLFGKYRIEGMYA